MSQPQQPVVLISGATGHVGRAVALELQHGATLALFERRLESASGLEDSTRHLRFPGIDLNDAQRVQAAVADVRQSLGPIRALVHTVGGYAGGVQVEDPASPDVARQMMELNYFAAINLVRAVLPSMLEAKAGTVVLFGSAAALKGSHGHSAYAASKAALLRFAEALAEEAAPHVRVRIILPTVIDTPINRKAMPSARFDDWVTPEQIAKTVSFLIHDASSGIRYAALPMGR